MIMSKWTFEISDYLGQRLVKGRSDFIKGKSSSKVEANSQKL